MRIRSGTRTGARIPTASMADIAFLLLIFFLTSTVFRLENGLEVDLPRAESGVGAARQRSTHVWVDRTGEIAIDDYLVGFDQIGSILAAKLKRSGELVVNLQIDQEVPYETVDRVLMELKRVNIRNVRLGTEGEVTPP